MTLQEQPIKRTVPLTLPRLAPKLRRRRIVTGYLFASPWILGFLAIYLIPLLLSLYYSFTNFKLVRDPIWIGLSNYERLLMSDTRFATAIYNTLFYTSFHVPLNLAGALLIAIALNRAWPGTWLFRAVIFLPSVLAGVAMALAWKWMFNGDVGVVNWVLSFVGIDGPAWLQSLTWSKPAFVIMEFWTIGPPMLIFLAALQSVPPYLYEAAELDGAGPVRRFWHVTVPMLSPAILFNSITLIIQSFKIFTPAWVLTSTVNAIGTPGDSTLFFVIYLFWQAFVRFEFGYASAMAWLLTIVVIAITIVQMVMARFWVHYENE